MSETSITLRIEGMTCDGCAASIEHALRRQRGVRRVKVNWRAKSGEVTFASEEVTVDEILQDSIFRRHYAASVMQNTEEKEANIHEPADAH